MMLLVNALVAETKSNLYPWYARVPTDSNISDSPSRLDTTKLDSMGVIRVRIDLGLAWKHVTDTFEKWG